MPSIEELQKDIDEFGKLLGEATRSRVKDTLTRAKAETEKELVNLEMKQRLAAERQAASTAEGGAAQKRYLCELTEFAWDQSNKFVKLFVTLDGVQTLDESSVTTTFSENSMQLHVNNLKGKDYGLTINNMLHAVDVANSYRKVKNGMVAIYMKKMQEGTNWEHLTTIQKRLKDKQDKQLKAVNENGDDALINMMKKIYNSGDSKTKQLIAKTWTENQEKAHMGKNTEL